MSIVEKHAPLDNITLKANHLPYITSDNKKLIRQRDYLRDKANRTGSAVLRQAFQQIKHKVVYVIRKTRTDYFTKKTSDNEGNLKRLGKH